MKEWEKDSWQDFEKRHLPNYEDENKLRQVLKTLESFPPLVFNGEIDLLNRELKNVAEGKSFLLQGEIVLKVFLNLVLITLEILLG